MTDGIETDDDCTIHVQQRRPGRTQNLLGGVALAFITLACGWTLYTNLAGTHPDIVVTAPQVTMLATPSAAPTADAAPARPAVPRPAAAARPAHLNRGLLIAPTVDVALFGKATMGLPPVRFSLGETRGPAMQQDVVAPARSAQIPLPMPRPPELALAHQAALAAIRQRSKPADPFETLFGKRPETGSALGYAPASSPLFDSKPGAPPLRLPQNDGLTAIYDIKARTVYMPDGTKLEAHSGLGPRMDDPAHVNVRMHGATPPHVYDLTLREAPFHGDEALRMHPVGGAEAIFGRTGLLTHSYLLGPNGQSNGCVSFKDYLTFVNAYKAGKVKRMVVVASIEDPQIDVRSLERRSAPQVVRASPVYTSSIAAPFPGLQDDRYLPDLSASRASRTSSSARSL